MGAKVILVQSDTLGRGEEQLGSILMANFLRLTGESDEKPSTLIFWNTGVRLVCEGSKVLGHIKRIAEAGVEVLACTTCLEYFDLTNKLAVGKPTTMAKTIQSILADDVISL
jgi:selenium metabolism protein YedF